MASWKGFKQWLRYRDQEMAIKTLAIGMNSTIDVTKDRHIIMLDYDDVSIDDVKKSVQELQLFWGLADCDIYSTKNGFHVFFWYDIVPYERVKMVISYARGVDPMFKYISRYYDHKTIRVSGKYAVKDREFVERVAGVREPTAEERELGGMKHQEHDLMSGFVK